MSPDQDETKSFPVGLADALWVTGAVALLLALRDFVPAVSEALDLVHVSPEIVAGMLAVGTALILAGGRGPRTARSHRRQRLGLFLLAPGIFFLTGSFGGEIHADHATGNVDWRTSFDEALAEAQRDGKPMLLDFSAEWCGACQELNHRVFADPRVEAKLAEFVTVRVDLTRPTRDADAVATRYGVTELPTLLFLDAEGRLLADKTVVGIPSTAAFLRRLDAIRPRAVETTTL